MLKLPQGRAHRELCRALPERFSLTRGMPGARKAYLAKDRRTLLGVVKDTTRTIALMRRQWRAHRAIWLEEHKPFGLEVLDLRYGGQLSRLDILRETLQGYLAGRVPSIPEFEVKPRNLLGKYPYHGRKYRGTASPVFSVWV